MKTKKVFETAVVGGIEVKNIIFRSATGEAKAINNKPSPQFYEMYENLSKGEVGLIITSPMSFAKTDHPTDDVIVLNNDAEPHLTKMTDEAHKHGTKIVAQLIHFTSQLFTPPTGPVFGPSDYVDPVSGIPATAFSKEQILELIKEFGQAALLAKTAGFDGVQLHGAHGYLLNKFLSPAFNTRTDEYGGSPECRVRAVVDILTEIKTTCGSDFPVWIKLNSSDFHPEDKGVTESDFLRTAEVLAQKGMDAIEVSGGSMAGTLSFSRSKKHVAYHLESAKKLTKLVNSDVILVGGFRELDIIESVLSDTEISAISLSRPLIREPDLVKRWMSGDRSKAKCVACNGCFNPKGVRCFFELTEEEKEEQKPMMKMFNANS
jgi:2,4-dienoyl-CoA reductase-like NADH-dependent reductase (Old Yellow Enzyme family)